MRLPIAFILAAAIVLGAPLAHGRLYRQVDPETGMTTYSNLPPQRQRKEERMQAAPLPKPTPIPVAPATPITPVAPAAPIAPEPKPARRPLQTERAVPATTVSNYRGFPRVSADTQKQRDSERRRILLQELAWEQGMLDQAVESRAGGDTIHRHRTNIDALNREIANTQ